MFPISVCLSTYPSVLETGSHRPQGALELSEDDLKLPKSWDYICVLPQLGFPVLEAISGLALFIEASHLPTELQASNPIESQGSSSHRDNRGS